MRAYPMPSLPEMPMVHNNDIYETKQMQLKVLYSLDDNNFLARSTAFHPVKTARVVIPGQNTLMQLGVIPIRDALGPIVTASPEIFDDFTIDYSVYVKDVSEEDEPFVGHGLVSKIFHNNIEENLIPGRVCTNFASLLGNKSSKETLEIKVKLVRVKRVSQAPKEEAPVASQQPAPVEVVNKHQEKPKKASARRAPSSRRSSNAQSQQLQAQSQLQYQPLPLQPQTQQFHQLPQPQQQQNSGYKRPYSQDNPDEGFAQPQKPQRKLNSAPARKAVRTQSLPVFEQQYPPQYSQPRNILSNYPHESIAKKIFLADKQNALARSGSVIYEDVNSRFPSFQPKPQQMQPAPLHTQQPPPQQHQLPPTATFLHTSTSAHAPTQAPAKTSQPVIKKKPVKAKSSPTIPESNKEQPAFCSNCKIVDNKEWRYFPGDEIHDESLLCGQCFVYLKQTGEMRPAGKTIQLRQKKKQKTDRKNGESSSAIPSSSPPQVLTPVDDKKILSQQNQQQPQQLSNTNDADLGINNPFINSSDPLSEFDGIMNHSDLDFQIGPLTDIDPLPAKDDQSQFRHPNFKPSKARPDNKENNPPASVQLKKYNDETSFEKMLVRSFSEFSTNTSTSPSNLLISTHHNNANTNSPSDWMIPDIFHDLSSLTKDTPSVMNQMADTPRDVATCNTLPIEESPEKATPQPMLSTSSASKAEKKKVSNFPSSPFIEQEEGSTTTSGNSSPNDQDSLMIESAQKHQNWTESDFTRLSSDLGNVEKGSPNGTTRKFVLRADDEGNAGFFAR